MNVIIVYNVLYLSVLFCTTILVIIAYLFKVGNKLILCTMFRFS